MVEIKFTYIACFTCSTYTAFSWVKELSIYKAIIDISVPLYTLHFNQLHQPY